MQTSEFPFAVASAPEVREDTEVAAATDLDGVGPATATVIDAAGFTAADIAGRRVSYHELREAGIDPVVADRLRRTYSLVWSFRWRPGADLRRRAERIDGLSEEERAWIAASVRDRAADEDGPTPTDATSPPEENEECPRCGSELTVYTLGESRAVECGGCGYTGIAIDA